ncbi:MAG TPA: crosslink repair DNA glycosylase YcaQ family protein [Anaerolineaceae bacterium]|nr:crosslink repair DNA glycosylase YcaQ family protein [Anaerolineaceae bacterium]HOD44561.1 crosslink repair DNA glycosylase YcaQ family protein [Anaerolineaceae bacterium]HPA32817.1 crosslink repair DNA glycosylase YcaQ family protein [Anaerolineaceae bacterium]
MSKNGFPNPSVVLTKQQARKFLLNHHHLLKPRALPGRQGILEVIQLLGCIQFDPVNVVGRNPDLVLQSRVRDYQPSMLYDLLYKDRLLWDGWDKLASIYPAGDWHYFGRHRKHMLEGYGKPEDPPMQVAEMVREAIRKNGASDSLSIRHDTRMDWWWGKPVSLVRACMEILYFTGELGIHHRTGTRRFFDFTENLLAPDLYHREDPNITQDDYHNWHVLRRIGSLGMARVGGSDAWLGIAGLKTPERVAALHRLIEDGRVLLIGIQEHPGKEFFIRTGDWEIQAAGFDGQLEDRHASFLAPLDNMLWDRGLVQLLFDFSYTWEVYKPPARRTYGHYTLPVLYGDAFVARMDARMDKKSRTLVLQNWWWEPDITLDSEMHGALLNGIHDFSRYLEADYIRVEDSAIQDLL